MSQRSKPAAAAKRSFKTEQVIVDFDVTRLKAPILLRCGAVLIDYIILISIPVIGLLLARYSGDDGAKLFTNKISNASWLIMILFAITNFVIFPLFSGQSVGKMLTGLRVVNSDGGQPSLGKLFLRHFVGYIVTFLTLGLGFFPAVLNKSGRALHDYLSGTIVIYGKKRTSEEII
jgi:uncharacterized RDD family membrane protein YckC